MDVSAIDPSVEPRHIHGIIGPEVQMIGEPVPASSQDTGFASCQQSSAWSQMPFINPRSQDDVFGPSEPSRHTPLAQSTDLYSSAAGNQNMQSAPLSMPTDEPDAVYDNTTSYMQMTRPRVRGQFAPERRQEVRELRKRGACLRCRMLKKSCSQGMPCQACLAVDSPRLWKVECVQTKLDEEFDLYLVMFNMTHADALIEDLVGNDPQSTALDEILVASYQESGPRLTLKARHLVPSAGTDELESNSEALIVADLQLDSDTLNTKQFLKAMTDHVIEDESNVIMQESLRYAQNIVTDQQNLQRNMIGHSDNLLSKVVELWVATALVSDASLLADFKIQPDPKGTLDLSINCIKILQWQLRGKIEKRAAILCRNILQSIEKRLMVRKKNQAFETFLVGFIFFNCVERMRSLFARQESSGLPQDAPVAHYVNKTDRFVEIFTMLFNTRNLLPKITVDPATGFLILQNEDEPALAKWLRNIGLTGSNLAPFGIGGVELSDFRCFDGLFCRRLLNIEN
jgi:hypothetical protein